MDWLTPILSKINDPAVLIPVLGCMGLGWLLVSERRENRTDRLALMDLLTKNTEALNQMRVTIAAILGKAV
jgi:hypothetical protein